MGNRLVDHLRERGRVASAGFVARWLRPLSRARWRQAVVLLKTQPVGRITLALAVAFAFGVVIGVGVAAVVGPQSSGVGGTVAAAVGQGAASQRKPVERASYAVPVRVREDGPKAPAAAAAAADAPQQTASESAPTSAPASAPTSASAEPPHAAPAPVAAAPAVTAEADDKETPAAPQAAASSPVALASAAPQEPGDKAPPPSATPPSEPLVRMPAQAATELPAGVQVPLSDITATPAVKPELAPAPSPAAKATPAAKPALMPKPALAAEAAAAEPSKAPPETPIPDAAVSTPPTDAPAAANEHADARAKAAPAADTAASSAPAGGKQLALLSPGLRDPEIRSPAEGAQTPDRPVVQSPPSGEKKPQLVSLPMLHSDAPWIRNAVRLPKAPRNVEVAIIIDDMGIDQKRSKLAIKLPPPLTLSFIPYGYHLHKLVATARAAGHEIMLHVPMEPLDPNIDPGPHALRTTLSVAENHRRLLWDFSRFSGYVGLNNHMGSKFTAWKPGMEMVMNEVRKRGLLFVDSFTSNTSVGFRLARADRLPSAARDIFIDHTMTRAAIAHSLEELEHIARHRGYAVGIAHPHDLSREMLAKWIPEAKARGVSFVPISYIVRREMKSE